MEYVRVVFRGERRTVFVDGTAAGVTNITLRVERATHAFDLGEPRNYRPAAHQRLVSGTTVEEPLEVIFEKIREV